MTNRCAGFFLPFFHFDLNLLVSNLMVIDALGLDIEETMGNQIALPLESGSGIMNCLKWHSMAVELF